MPHHTIRSLTITGGTHFPSLRLDFSDHLNVLIGTRGTGKSGILNYLLYALGVPVPPLYLQFVPKYDDYIRTNLGAGKLTLELGTQHGATYTSTRAYGEPARVYASDGSLANVTLSGELFQIDAYAQGALEAIGRTPAAQLELIDRRVEAEARRIEGAITEIERRLAQSATERATLAADIADDEGLIAELPQVTEALKALQLPGGEDPAAVARAGEQKVRRGHDRLAMSELTKGAELARAGLDAYATGALAQLSAGVNAERERGGHAPSAEVFRRAHEAVHRARGAIEAAAGTLRDTLVATAKALEAESRALSGIHALEEEEYRALVVARDADRERAAERERLHRRFEELSGFAARLEARRRKQGELAAERDRLSERRSALFLELGGMRDRVGCKFTVALRDEVRVSVEQAKDRRAYRALVGELVKGHNIRTELLDKVAEGLRPRALLAAIEANDVAAIEAVDRAAGSKTERAVKLLAVCAASERLRELETVRLGDVPTIALNVNGEPQASDSVSVGQRCTCTLPLVLLHSISTLLLDQPEDNIDNAYIYNKLIPTLLERKRNRQLIIVTLNPNIPVLGDAERIFALAGGPTSGRLDAAGNVDEMRSWIELHLEGGRKAFRKRAERYGHLLKDA